MLIFAKCQMLWEMIRKVKLKIKIIIVKMITTLSEGVRCVTEVCRKSLQCSKSRLLVNWESERDREWVRIKRETESENKERDREKKRYSLYNCALCVCVCVCVGVSVCVSVGVVTTSPLSYFPRQCRSLALRYSLKCELSKDVCSFSSQPSTTMVSIQRISLFFLLVSFCRTNLSWYITMIANIVIELTLSIKY
jgi:hypothetical protein